MTALSLGAPYRVQSVGGPPLPGSLLVQPFCVGAPVHDHGRCGSRLFNARRGVLASAAFIGSLLPANFTERLFPDPSVRRRVPPIARIRLARSLPGLLLAMVALLVVAVPWHHAMYVRHGDPWWNELFGDNHWRRMVLGRHGDRGSFEYFLRELGYAMLPWLAMPLSVKTRRTVPSVTASRGRPLGVIRSLPGGSRHCPGRRRSRRSS